MVNKPPHLPTETCRVDTHHKMQNLRWIFFIFFIAILSGVAASLVTVAWVAPIFTPTDYYGLTHENRGLNRPDSFVVKQTRQKVLNVYDRRKITDKSFYSEKALVGQAVMLSSDGWLVLFYPDYISGVEKNWDILDYQGVSYKVQKSFFDSVAKMVYCKIDGQGFRVVSFLPSDRLNADDSFWALNKGLSTIKLTAGAIDIKKFLTIWQPQFYWQVDSIVDKGNWLFGQGGELVGVSGEDNKLIPAWVLENQLNSLLSNQTVSYKGLALKGYFVSSLKTGDIWKEISGFYVTESAAIAGLNNIGKGDVLIKINGQDVKPESLAEQILTAPNELEIVAYRKGEEVKVVVKKQVVK